MFRERLEFDLGCHIEGYRIDDTDTLNHVLVFTEKVECRKAVKKAEKRLEKDDLIYVKIIIKLNGEEIQSFRIFR